MVWLRFEVSTGKRWLLRKMTFLFTVIQGDTGFKNCGF